MDSVQTFRLTADLPIASSIASAVQDMFIGHASFILETVSTKKKMTSSVANASTILDMSLVRNKTAEQTLTQSVSFSPVLEATTQDVLNAYGEYLRLSNRKLDKALQDTQEISDRIDRYLESHDS